MSAEPLKQNIINANDPPKPEPMLIALKHDKNVTQNQTIGLLEKLPKKHKNASGKCLVVYLYDRPTDFKGLEKVFEYRIEKEDFQTPVLFVVDSGLFVPNFKMPHNIIFPHILNLIGKSEFGEVKKAVLLAESFISRESADLDNFLEISFDKDFDDVFEKKIGDTIEKNKDLLKINEDLRKDFYDTFITYYYPFTKKVKPKKNDRFDQLNPSRLLTHIKDEEIKYRIKAIENSRNIKNYDILSLADHMYRFLNSLTVTDMGGHHVDLELFHAPVPFSLHEFFIATEEVIDKIGTDDDHKINLILIDNKTDKYRPEKTDAPSIEDVLSKYLPKKRFKVEMIGGAGSSEDLEETIETFDYSKFKNNINIENDEQAKGKYRTYFDKWKNKPYRQMLLEKITSSDFVLLDFFLNRHDTYLAIDFIKDFAELKSSAGIFSPTWYFIASAVHDSVVKYSQSGVLAEHYESAIVSAGDDPTNPKRRIIFAYKLITLIHSRLKSFQSIENAISGSNLFSIKNAPAPKRKPCPDQIDWADTDECDKCLVLIQGPIRKYLAEYEDTKKLFPGIFVKDDKDLKKSTVELVERIINQFYWLPEADWPMIQRQIDLLNMLLKKHAPESVFFKHQFTCKRILNELHQRSEVY